MSEITENKKFFKQVQVDHKHCDYVVIYRERFYIKGNKDMQDGITIMAWHFTENGPFQQQESIPIPYDLIDDYIRDFSGVTAQNFVDRFTY